MAATRKTLRTPKIKANNSFLFVVVAILAFVGLVVWAVIAQSPGKTPHAGNPGCALSISTVAVGGSVTVNSVDGLFGSIGMQGAYGTPVYSNLNTLVAYKSASIKVPSNAQLGLYVVRVGGYGVACTPNLSVTAPLVTVCGYDKASVSPGDTIRIASDGYGLGVGIQGAYSNTLRDLNIRLNPDSNFTNVIIPADVAPGLYVVKLLTPAYAVTGGFNCKNPQGGDLSVSLQPACSLSTPNIVAGGQVTLYSKNGLSGQVNMQLLSGGPVKGLGYLNTGGSLTFPLYVTPGIYKVAVGLYAVPCKFYSPGSTTGFDLSVTAYTPTCRDADVDKSGVVNILDLSKISSAYNATIGQPKYSSVLDLNRDGVINNLDLTGAQNWFGQKC